MKLLSISANCGKRMGYVLFISVNQMKRKLEYGGEKQKI